MDNTGSTNKNQYVMAATLEILQQNVLDYFRIYGGRVRTEPTVFSDNMGLLCF